MSPLSPIPRVRSGEERRAAAREKAETEIERLQARIMAALDEISYGGQDISRAVNVASISKDLLMMRRRQAEILLNQAAEDEVPLEGDEDAAIARRDHGK